MRPETLRKLAARARRRDVVKVQRQTVTVDPARKVITFSYWDEEVPSESAPTQWAPAARRPEAE